MLLALGSCSRKPDTSEPERKQVQTVAANPADAQECLKAAQKSLGRSAIVLKCGELAGIPGLRAIAAVPVKPFHADADSIPFTKLTVLHKAGERWIPELTADNLIRRNPAGYIGIEFIDDSSPPVTPRVSFSGTRSDDSLDFAIYLTESYPDGDESWPIEIAWNPAVQRFQEYSTDHEPLGFRPEVKNPPHKKLGNCTGSQVQKLNRPAQSPCDTPGTLP